MARAKAAEPQEYAVHPVAALWPMGSDDAIADLAENIKAHGQQQPIVRDKEGRILDGRNRLAACRLAGVDPKFTTYEGDDAEGYALSANGQQNERSKAQKALIAARFLNDYKSIKKPAEIARDLRVSDGLIHQAVVIDRYAREHAEEVLLSGSGFADAFTVASERKREKEEALAKMQRLRHGAPDLLARVEDESDGLTLSEAITLFDAREKAEADAEEAARTAAEREKEQREREEREAQTRHRDRLVMFINGWPTFRDIVARPADPERTRQIVEGLGENDQRVLKEITEELPEVADVLA